MKVQIAEISHSSGVNQIYIYRWLKFNSGVLTIRMVNGRERIFTGITHLFTSVAEEKEAYIQELSSRMESIVPVSLLDFISEKARNEKGLFITRAAIFSDCDGPKYQTLQASYDIYK